MSEFYKRETDIIAHCDGMIAGYTQNPTLFPKSDVVALQAKRDAYQAAREDQNNKLGQAKMATQFKDRAIAELTSLMRRELKQSEVDCVDMPEKLSLIGWAPRTAPSAVSAPGQPQNLDPVIQGPGTIRLVWKTPKANSGGPVRTYTIERRDQPPGGTFSPWAQIAISMESSILLRDQPRGVQLEYRVLAVNNGGEGVPSNTAAVVL